MGPSNAPTTKPYRNPAAQSYTCAPPSNASEILAFHKTLPTYAQTPLVQLPGAVASALGLGSIHIKDETSRFSLPSFKILGASWAIYRTLCAALKLPHAGSTPTSLSALGAAAQKAGLRLVSCTDGNWGRSLAFTARLLSGVPATVYVPRNIDEATRKRIAGEGAEVLVVDGEYDDSIRAAVEASERSEGALLVLDTSWPGYEEIPRWVTEGYESMLAEVDETLASAGGGAASQPDLVIVSVGVGSWAHSVVSHYKSLPEGKRPLIATVEATAAPSLLTSLHSNAITSIGTKDTIMCGMNCGTTSTIAWPMLRDGVDIAVTVSDWESHLTVTELSGYGINAGPCGAAPLAALRRIVKEGLLDSGEQKLGQGARVVLFCTEGARPYEIPSEN